MCKKCKVFWIPSMSSHLIPFFFFPSPSVLQVLRMWSWLSPDQRQKTEGSNDTAAIFSSKSTDGQTRDTTESLGAGCHISGLLFALPPCFYDLFQFPKIFFLVFSIVQTLIFNLPVSAPTNQTSREGPEPEASWENGTACHRRSKLLSPEVQSILPKPLSPWFIISAITFYFLRWRLPFLDSNVYLHLLLIPFFFSFQCGVNPERV